MAKQGNTTRKLAARTQPEVEEFRREFGPRLGGADVVQIEAHVPQEFSDNLAPGGTICIAQTTVVGPGAFDAAVAAVQQLAGSLKGRFAMMA